MSYTAPSITASSATWDKQVGLRGNLDALVVANSTLTADQISLIYQTFNTGTAFRRMEAAIDQFFSGRPTVKASTNAELLTCATAAAVLLTMCNEVNTLVEANAVGITTITDGSAQGSHQGRVLV